MRRVFFVIAMVMGLGYSFWPATAASNCPVSTYTHNESLVAVRDCKGKLTITYTQPRQSLVPLGVSSGTMLFTGSEQAGGAITGHARTFKASGDARCGAIAFATTGSRLANTIMLSGNLPVRDANCQVIRYQPIEMVFTAQAGVASTCPQGYTLFGNDCVKTATPAQPKLSCPAGFVFNGGQCLRAAAPGSVPTAPSQPASLAYPLQSELQRIGCLPGSVDGIWGNSSRMALQRFAQRAGLNLGSEPSQNALNEARRRPSGFCPRVQVAPRPTQPRPTQTVRPKTRCSAIKFAFTRGNTCGCSGGRIFTGTVCVKPDQQIPQCKAYGMRCTSPSQCCSGYCDWNEEVDRKGKICN